MRLTTAILAVLVTVTMATPMENEPANEPANILQTLESRYIRCGCYPNCGCPTDTICECLTGSTRYAPCYPNCKCPTDTEGICVVSDSPLYSNRLYNNRWLTRCWMVE